MSIPESLIHKKNKKNNYNPVCEAVASDILRIKKDNVDTNLADLLTNIMTSKKLWD